MPKQALLVIDMLNDFVQSGAPLEVPGVREIISNIKLEIEQARQEKTPVIYLCDAHKKKDPEFRVWPPHAVKGTNGQKIVKELAPKKGDIVVEKATYSGFFQTKLDSILKKLKPERLILTGVCTEICVLYTAADAYMRGYKLTVAEGCTAGLTKQDHEFALKQMRQVLKPKQN